MKDENKTQVELIKELKLLREERGKEAFKDFAEHKPVEEALKESEEKYRNLIESVNESVISVDLQGNLVTLNSRAVSYLGGLAENYIGKTLWDIFPQKVAEERFAELQKVIQLGEPIIKESYIPFKGKTLCFLNSMQPIKNRSGDIYSVLILASDITEQKQAEEKLKDSEEYLQILFDYAPDAYYINDLKGNFIDGNKAAERLTGYKRKELIGKSFLKLKLLSLADIPKAVKLLAKNLRGQPTGPDEFVVNRKDNTKVAVEISTYPVKIKGKTYVLGIARDITERKQAEKTLRESEQRFRDVTENTLEWVWEVDVSGKYVYSSPVCEKILGYKPEELLEKHFYDLFVPEEQEQLKETAFKAFANKQPFHEFINLNIHKDGKLVCMSTSGVPILDKKGNLLGYRGVDMDITERKQAEGKLKKTRDAALDTMSRIIEAKDPYTSGHQHRVCQLAIRIAQELTLPEDKVEGIRIASLIHDIGKIGIPTEILSKPTKLSDIEFSLIKNHSQIGYDILKSNDFSYPVAQIILQHHERLNGSGYPNNLKGDEIILEARILGVADVVEAMSSHRPYRPALGIDKALEEISQNKGILYDPQVVEMCLKLFKEKKFKFE